MGKLETVDGELCGVRIEDLTVKLPVCRLNNNNNHLIFQTNCPYRHIIINKIKHRHIHLLIN